MITKEQLKDISHFETFFEFYDFLCKAGKSDSTTVKFDPPGVPPILVDVSEIKSLALDEIYSILPTRDEKNKLMRCANGGDWSLLHEFLFHKLPNK